MTSSNTDKKSKYAYYSVKQKRIETATLLEQDRIETKGCVLGL
ncbi:hypothetical protein [Nitrosopumilus sp.]|nr:hypothetical protein [Nitrosopumilus sp.]